MCDVCVDSFSTWEDVDVDDGEGVCVYVDDDVHAEQGHAKQDSELSDQSGHGLRAERRQAGHLLIQLGEQEEKGHVYGGLRAKPTCDKWVGSL